MNIRIKEMVKLRVQLVVPATIILFTVFTKWWYTLPIDAPDTMYLGFPFPYVGSAWHTSGALQFFVIELIADFLTYFLAVFFLLLFINRYIIKIKAYKWLKIIIWSLSTLILSIDVFISANKDNIFYLKRPYDMEIMETGCQLFWNNVQQPNYYKYHPEPKH